MIRYDAVLRCLFGFEKMANFKAVMRLFKRFTQETKEHVMNQLYRWMFSHVQINGGALDLGSSVIWRMYRGRADCENRIKELNMTLLLRISI